MPVFDLNPVPTDDGANVPSPSVTETIEYLYVYPNGFFPDRRAQIDVGDVVVSKESDPEDAAAGITPFSVLSVAAEDGDDLIILKVTRVGDLIGKVEFFASVSGSGAAGAVASAFAGSNA